jgi:hypothetical protein
MSRFKLLVASVLTAGAALLLAAPAAHADYGNLAKYQITFSENCNNASLCLAGEEGLGGDWGWAVLNTDGTGDLQITFCGHQPGVGGGAGHEAVDIYAWHIADGVFFIDSASDPNFVGPTPIPGAPGHYSQHPAPGVAIEITVTAIPNR